MADGFLSPDGIFYEKKEAFHAEAARRILGDTGEHPDPVRELIQAGYLAMIEFRAPNGTVSLQPDMDYILARRDGKLTPQQLEWLKKNTEMLSKHQQYVVNMAREGIFEEIVLNGVKTYMACAHCPASKERQDWCDGKNPEEPALCGKCIYALYGWKHQL